MSGHVLTIALGNSLLWSVYLLLTRHVVSGAQLDAWAYTLVQLLTAEVKAIVPPAVAADALTADAPPPPLLAVVVATAEDEIHSQVRAP